jgi:hypothetical protein
MALPCWDRVGLLRGYALMFLPLMLAQAAVATAPAATTIQQDYEAAQAALDGGRAGEARQRFEALLKRMPPGSKSRSAHIVRARLGAALVFDSQPEAALPYLEEAIGFFGGAASADVQERAMALHDRARAREMMGQFRVAAEDLKIVRGMGAYPKGGPHDVELQAMLARVLLWSEPAMAEKLVDELLALPQGTDPLGKAQLAYAQALRGRAELVQGNANSALGWLQKAGRTAGGTTSKRVSLLDVQVRADLALAYHLGGNKQEQQKAVAFSGAGSLVAEGFNMATFTPLPDCAPVTGLDPKDVAVIEFEIGDDGRAKGARPVYAMAADGKLNAADQGPASLFTDAVRHWTWNEADVAKLNGFWRQSVRVELRCRTGRGGDPIIASFDAEADQLAADWGLVSINPSSNLSLALAEARAMLAREELARGPTARQLVVPLEIIAGSPAAPEDEKLAAQKRRVALLDQHQAPPDLLVRERARLALMDVDARDIRDAGADLAAREAALAPLLSEQDAARPESRTTQWLRLRLSAIVERRKAPDRARTYLDRIVATPEDKLGRADPIRTAALLRLSNIAAAARDTEAAASALAATGLTPEQCALVDVKPLPENISVPARTFPEEAQRWGSQGYARLAFDITAEGVPTNIRTIVAAPPFVFGPASEKALAQFRYKPVFRPGNTLGCSDSTQNFRFMTGP